MSDYNNMNQNFIMDLVSALDYLGDIDAYLHECDKESLPCDIKYLKEVRFALCNKSFTL